MPDSQKQYIVNLANLVNSNQESVGQLAFFIKSALEKGITLPVGFVLTTKAFDDFLIANDLVDKIGSIINSLDYQDIDQIQIASESIHEAFKKSVFPDLIKQPLKKAYSGFVGFSEGSVNARVSSINNELKLSIKGGIESIIGISGFENLLESIKEIWADFFSPNALMYRGKIGYEGYLTEAVVVQKLVHAEISGKIYTVNTTDHDPTVIEIQAIWGLDNGNIFNEVIPDSYLIDKRTGEVIEKRVISQDFMYVVKSRSDAKEPYMKVNISPVWQKRSKLDDRHLYLLFDYASRIIEITGSPQEISWCIESGRVFFMESNDYETNVDVAKMFPLKSFKVQEKLDSILSTDEDGNKQQDIKLKIEDYVKEVNENMSKEPVAEEDSEDKKSEIELEVPKIEPLEKDLPDVESEEFENPVEYEDKVIEKIKENEPIVEDKIVVDVEPIDKLTKILKGKGHKNKVKFGLAHFVFADYDMEDLTGDEILILKTFKSADSHYINSVKGAVIESAISEASLENVRVPVIHGIKNAFEVLHDKEVITLDPENGDVLLGAGVKDLTELKVDRRGMVDKNAEKAQDRLSAKLPLKLYDDPANVPIKTTSDFWQYLDFSNLLIDHRNSQGYFLVTSDLMKSLGYDPRDLLINKNLQELYIQEAMALIRNIFNLSHLNHIIIQSFSKQVKEQYSLQDKTIELLNLDIELVLNLRNKDNFRSVWLAFGDVCTESELIELKKEVTAKGIRRSSTFKLLGVVNNSYSALNAKSLVENNSLDGLLIDLNELLFSITGKFNTGLDKNIVSFVRYIIELSNSNMAMPFVLYRGEKLNNDFIKSFLDAGLTQFITEATMMVEQKLQISDLELLQITKMKKRGRKKKKIDFGF